MRASQLLISTLKESPQDAQIVSHQLMLRAGLIRKVAAGIYHWLPLGLRVLKKVEAVVHKQMQNIGAQELLMPSIQPAQLWKTSERWEQYGAELLRVKDRHQREFCIGPTHEEVITALMANEIRSYKQLPQIFYQIQTKFRDEIRPRFGVMRSREFIMKDAYSFHIDQKSLEETYQKMYRAYHEIFTALGLHFFAVDADTGSIGGSGSHEFHVLADSGEDAIAVCEKFQYAANVEKAEAMSVIETRQNSTQELQKSHTPQQKTIEQVCEFLQTSPEKTIKTLLVKGTQAKTVALVLRGDHELNEIKAQKHPLITSPLVWVDPKEINNIVPCQAGSIGVVNLPITVIADRSAANLHDFVCGANEDDQHYLNVNWGRDCPEPEIADIRTVQQGDICSLASNPNSDLEEDKIVIKRGIEVGHIFQLGDKYSRAMKAHCLSQEGKPTSMTMGCYGIGITRIVAAAIEQHHDDNGIVWPSSIAPFQIILIGVGYHKSEAVKNACDELYTKLIALNIEVLLDDRQERPGVQFSDADLIGVPHRVTIGAKSLAENKVEYKSRSEQQNEFIGFEGIIDYLQSRLN